MNDEELLQLMTDAGKKYPTPARLGRWRHESPPVQSLKSRLRVPGLFAALGAPMTATLTAASLVAAGVIALGIARPHNNVPAGRPTATVPTQNIGTSPSAVKSPGPSPGATQSAPTQGSKGPSPGSGAASGGVPAAQPTPSVDCINRPSACGFPDSTNTGVPSGTHLSPVPGTNVPGATWNATYGELDVTTPGAVIQNISLADGVIRIEANNVTVKNVSASASGPYFTVDVNSGVSGTVIEDSAFSGVNGSNQSVQYAIQDSGNGTHMQRLNMFNCWECVNSSGVLQDSYIHNLATHQSAQDVSGSGGPITIRHNTMLNQQNQEAVVFCSYTNCTVDDNLIAGGAYVIYGGQDSSQPGSGANVVITNNRLSTLYFSSCGQLGYDVHFAGNLPGDVWSGNVWDNNNQVVAP